MYFKLKFIAHLFSDGGLFTSLLREDDIWGAVGCHPKNATDYSPNLELVQREMLRHPRVKALGEIGLDYSGKSVALFLSIHIQVLPFNKGSIC